MSKEGSHWSDPDCVLCSWLPDLDPGTGNKTDQICARCAEYDMASTAHRVREPRKYYLKQAESCEERARSTDKNELHCFSSLMWWRTALRWRLAAVRVFRWIPDTGTRTRVIFLSRSGKESNPEAK